MKKYQQGSVRIGQIQKSDTAHLSRKMPLMILVCLMAISVQFAFAQSGMSILRGTVQDQNGAGIPGVTLTITEPSTGLTTRMVVSGNNGDYEIPGIKPGTYKVKAEKNGFKIFSADDLLLESGQTRRVDITLTVGGTSEEVTVSAGAATINTENGTITSSINSKKYADTPLIDAYPSPLAMFSTMPGIQGNGWDLRMAGQGAAQQSFALDGVNNDRTGEQNNNMNFYEEASITAVNAGANSARLGGYNLVSKRGKNEFHGMVYYKHFNSALNAANFWEKAGGTKKTPFIQHEWHGEISGPIWKNKSHFYFGWFQQRIPLGSFSTATVPTNAMRAGDFSALTPYLRDPLKTGLCNKNGQEACFPGSIIPSNRINPVSAKLQEYYPKANRDFLRANSQNYQWVHPYNSDFYLGNWPFIRIDHQFNSKNSIFGRWTQRKTPYVLPSGVPELFWTRLRDHRQTVITDTHVFSSALINVFRFGLASDLIEDGKETDGQLPIQGDQVLTQIGLQGVNPKYNGAGFPSISIANGPISINGLGTVAGGVKNNDKIYTFGNDLTWQKSNHVWKFGAEYVRFTTFYGENPNYGGFSFDGRYTDGGTKIGYADFLLGIPSASSRTVPLVNRDRNNKELGIYISDTFKVTQNLTLDFGLRWDYYGMPVFNDGLMYNFDVKTGKIIVDPGMMSKVNPRFPNISDITTGQVVPGGDKKNFRPRISAAYRLGEDFVIRGGYGQFTERFDRDYFALVNGPGPFASLAENFDNKGVNDPAHFTFPNPFPSSGATPPPSQSVREIPSTWNNGSIHQFNLSIEKAVKNLGLRASYVGSRGRGLNFNYGINIPAWSSLKYDAIRRPFPKFNGVSRFSNEGKSNYNSLQFEVNRRQGWYTFNAHYTLTANLNNIMFSGNPNSPTSEWARDDATRRHIAIVSSNWDLPFGKGKRFMNQLPGALDVVLGGWQLQTISEFGSGKYFTPTVCGFDFTGTNSNCARADIIGDPKLSGDQKTYNNWFNKNAYKTPGCPDNDPFCKNTTWVSPGRIGNAGSNSLEGQGLNVHHLSLTKKVKLTERLAFTFTSSMSNLFNHQHFYTPSGRVDLASGSTMGGVIADFEPEKHGRRMISFKGRFEF